MTNKQKLDIARKALQTWKEDSEMALNGKWQINGYELHEDSRDAFEASLEVAEKALEETE